MLPTTMITIHAAVCSSAIDDDDDEAKCKLRKEIHLLPFVERKGKYNSFSRSLGSLSWPLKTPVCSNCFNELFQLKTIPRERNREERLVALSLSLSLSRAQVSSSRTHHDDRLDAFNPDRAHDSNIIPGLFSNMSYEHHIYINQSSPSLTQSKII